MRPTSLPKADVDAAIRSSIAVLASISITPAELSTADQPTLLSLQRQLLMGDQWGEWRVPPELIAAHRVLDSACSFRLALALPPGADPSSPQAQKVWCELMRVAIACRLWPNRRGRRATYSTIRSHLAVLGRLSRDFYLQSDSGFWVNVTQEEVNSRPKMVRKSVALLRRLQADGAICDAPLGVRKISGQAPPRHRKHESELSQRPDLDLTYQPFSDEFTAALGCRALKFINLYGPALLDVLEASLDISIDAKYRRQRAGRTRTAIAPRSMHERRVKVLNPLVRSWRWIGPDGRTIEPPPMHIRTSGRVGAYSWPPKTFPQVWSLLSIVQGSNLWAIALATAGRKGEVLSLREDCLERSDSDQFSIVMRTTKLDGVSGRLHHVPAPEVVRRAVALQIRLVRLVKKYSGVSGDHMWVSLDRGIGVPLASFSYALRTLVSSFDLSSLLEGTNAHMHRFRKTLVRMTALSLVHAPKVLMDVLGHRDEQMTVLRYILSDPGILQEIQEVVREMVVLKGVEAVRQIDHLQGGAAIEFRSRVADYAKRVGSSALEPQNLMEFVRSISEDGVGWAIIAPGIVCTGFTRGGLCNHGQGSANPDFCHPSCGKQLVMQTYDEDGIRIASAVSNAISSIEFLLEQLAKAEAESEEMLIAQFLGQIRTLLGRWHEVDAHFSSHQVLSRYGIPINVSR